MASSSNTPRNAAQARAQLLEAQDRFIASWGRMGSVWGISRTMAEVHALLYITGQPMCTDEIMERLGVSRGNVSMSVRSLLEWGVIEKVRHPGDRKEYFQAEQDVWSMLRAIARERIKREVDPLLDALDEIGELAPRVEGQSQEEVRDLHKRLDEIRDGFGLITTLAHKFAGPRGAGLQTAARLLAKAPVGRKKSHTSGRTKKGGDA
ncbi:MAG: MarR family transcriptional regulator [Phycisphaerales bacterium]|jgi:DNA-binding transcriptional regulator GbsR (MarR family)|nr:MarR family transcriptional regulator [Phycisphaerales bacterium]